MLYPVLIVLHGDQKQEGTPVVATTCRTLDTDLIALRSYLQQPGSYVMSGNIASMQKGDPSWYI